MIFLTPMIPILRMLPIGHNRATLAAIQRGEKGPTSLAPFSPEFRLPQRI